MTTSRKLSQEQIQARREALLAAERSGMMEGLPPRSPLACELGERYAQGELTADEVCAALTRHYSTLSDAQATQTVPAVTI